MLKRGGKEKLYDCCMCVGCLCVVCVVVMQQVVLCSTFTTRIRRVQAVVNSAFRDFSRNESLTSSLPSALRLLLFSFFFLSNESK